LHDLCQIKQTTLSAPKPAESAVVPPPSKQLPSFFEWYEKEKETLAEEFPNLSATELSRQGMKRFKELLQTDKMVRIFSFGAGMKVICCV
jgi:hypothetical protein